jgi:hypothetical protein
MRSCLSVLLLIMGCNGSGLGGGGGADSGQNGETPPGGIYEASSGIVSNDCSMPPSTLDGQQAITAKGGTLNVPDLQSTPASALTSVERLDLTGGPLDVKMDDCGAGRELLLEVTHEDGHSVDLRYTVTWTSTHSATQVSCGIPGNDCTSVVTTHFELQSACESPCTIANKVPGGLFCSCPE